MFGCVPGGADLWSDLGVFAGIEQAHSESFSPSYPAPTNYCEYCCEDVCGGDPSCRSDPNKLGPRCLLSDPSAALEGRCRTAGRSRMCDLIGACPHQVSSQYCPPSRLVSAKREPVSRVRGERGTCPSTQTKSNSSSWA